jgi:hypothetical protein
MMPGVGETAEDSALGEGGAVGCGVATLGAAERVGVLAGRGTKEGKAGVIGWQAVSKKTRMSNGNGLDRYSRITSHLLLNYTAINPHTANCRGKDPICSPRTGCGLLNRFRPEN